MEWIGFRNIPRQIRDEHRRRADETLLRAWDSAIGTRQLEARRDVVLYHYTTLAGLRGILTSGYLKAFDTAKYANEVPYRQRRTAELLDDIIEGEGDESLGTILRWSRSLLDHPALATRLFGASLCEADSNPILWMNSEGRSSEVAIGFAIDPGLYGHSIDQMIFGGMVKMLYNEDEQRACVRALAAATKEILSLRPLVIRELVVSSLTAFLSSLHVLLKEPKYAPEDEWRLAGSCFVRDTVPARRSPEDQFDHLALFGDFFPRRPLPFLEVILSSRLTALRLVSEIRTWLREAGISDEVSIR